jgi:D-ribulokinase
MAGVFIGVDVGSASARAGVFDDKGTLLAAARHSIRIWRDADGVVEQSSADIWSAVAAGVREAVRHAGVAGPAVRGIGFDATCSLVVLDDDARPLAVGPSEDPQRDIIMWMDHRAVAEAQHINATAHPVLRYIGGVISPEMQTPKLLWLKRHRPRTFAAAGNLFDLSDFLTFRATGSLARSTCTVTCKWTYLAHERRWDDTYFDTIGLGELTANDYRRIGREIVAPGSALGGGLTSAAATELGLEPGTPVGAALIDAHAGGVGTIGGLDDSGESVDATRRIGYIMGTSACIMATTRQPSFVPGVWGPYYSAMVPGSSTSR